MWLPTRRDGNGLHGHIVCCLYEECDGQLSMTIMVSVVVPVAIAPTSRASPGEDLESIQRRAGLGPLQNRAGQGSRTGPGSSTSLRVGASDLLALMSETGAVV
ncbi:hypothetical protein llap_14946 [Limosa lapponica baueri]|uniref:Uncharacterized protein n=1 Tax=Limosa lapponica baueri TaxID=1758121 RepID=A0A2I0TLQ7_LIMLA|nr:hypothetical protein llap_14946 [Limosa lapponica baueri]